MEEEKLYEYVLTKEIETNNLNKGFWAKALAQVTWDENKAKVVYIENRVAYFKEYLKKHNIDYIRIEIDQLDKIVQRSLQDGNEVPSQQPKVENNTPNTAAVKNFAEENTSNTDKVKNFAEKNTSGSAAEKKVKKENTSFREYYFHDDKRVNQKEYLFRTFFPFASFISILFILMYINQDSLKSFHLYGATIVAFLIITSFTLYPTMKRLQDINTNSWFSIFMFIPIINILFLLQLILTPSYNGRNEYGETSAEYNLNLYGYMGLLLESSIIIGLVLSTMLHLGYINKDNISKNDFLVNKGSNDVIAAYELAENTQNIVPEIEDTSSKEIIPVDVDKKMLLLDTIQEKEVAVTNSNPIEIANSTQKEQLLAEQDVKQNVKKVNLLQKSDSTKTIVADLEDEIVAQSVDSEEEIVTLSLGPEEQRLANIYLEDELNKDEPILQNINYEASVPKKQVQKKVVNKKKDQKKVVVKKKIQKKEVAKKLKKHQLYLITIPYRSKVTFVDKNLTYKDNMKLLPGSYKIKVEKKGYVPEYRTINLNNDVVEEFFLKRNS